MESKHNESYAWPGSSEDFKVPRGSPPGLARSVAAELRPALVGDRDGGTQEAARDIATAHEVLWQRMVEIGSSSIFSGCLAE